MKTFLDWFRSGGWITLLALLLVLLVIWLVGPYVAVAGVAPLAPVLGRLVATLLLALVAAAFWIVRLATQQRSNRKLADAMAAPAKGGAGGGDPEQIRQRFEEALKLLQKNSTKRTDLYSLPWYVIIGPPGSGKTTILANSGLKFPLQGKFGKSSVRGIGGTRNCDWWFTDEAVLLDTAGRFTTQDSDEHADAQGWNAFLAQLKKHRPLRPVNGILLAISLADLLSFDEDERRNLVSTIQQRFDEIYAVLRVTLPVYVLFTKCDLLAGFTEFFDGLGHEGRAQVWGATFPLGDSRGEVAGQVEREFDQLAQRLHEMTLERLEGERDVTRRARVFGLPAQFGSVRKLVLRTMSSLFDSSGEGSPLLRGFYFTSGTQEGSPIDRLMGVISRSFKLELAPAQSGRSGGRAYFIEALFRKVIFAESGLAGRDERMERRALVSKAAALAAVALLGCGLLLWMALSYGRNQAYLAQIDKAVQALPPVSPGPYDSAAAAVIAASAQLDALRKLTAESNPYADGRPLAMSAGLYQVSATSQQVADAYGRDLNANLVPLLAQQVATRMDALRDHPELLYLYLKAYIMLGQSEHLDAGTLRTVLQAEAVDVAQGDPALAEALNGYIGDLLGAKPPHIHPVATDAARIEKARYAISTASPAVVVIGMLGGLPEVGQRQAEMPPLSTAVPGIDNAFVRASRTPFSEPLSWLYSVDGFKFAREQGLTRAFASVDSEPWVLGPKALTATDSIALRRKAQELYESSYQAYWRALLDDLRLKPTPTPVERGNQLALLSTPDNPIKGIVKMVAANTQLGADADPSAPPGGPLSAAGAKVGALEDRLNQAAGGIKLGQATAQAYAGYRQIVAGPEGQASVDQVTRAISAYNDALASMSVGAVDPLAMNRIEGSARQLLAQVANWPAPPKDWVAALITGARSDAQRQAQQQGATQVASDVGQSCSQLVGRRYPFVRGAGNEVPLQDFSAMFASGGRIDAYFQQNLANFVDQSPYGWRWRNGVSTPPATPAQLAMFQHAAEIRDALFPGHANLPSVTLDLSLSSVSPGVQKVVAESNGASVDLAASPNARARLLWPGSGAGYASLQLVLAGGAVEPLASAQGDWALFRVLDQGQPSARGERAVEFHYSRDGYQLTLLVTAGSLHSPLSRATFESFHCAGE